MLRIAKIVLIVSVAAYCLLGMVGNVAGWASTLHSVGGVVSMASVDDGPRQWPATSNPAIIVGTALFFIAFKTAAGVTCLAGAWRMWCARRADSLTFSHAKALALTGCAIALFGLYFGWAVIGEQIFEMWRSRIFSASANTAFRYGAYIALIAIFVGMREE